MILDLLRERHSARKFLDRPIPCKIVTEMLEGARLAPSGGNEQAWAFGVVTKKDLIKEISSLSYHNVKWMTHAPLIVALCTRLTGCIAVKEERSDGYCVLQHRCGPAACLPGSALEMRLIAESAMHELG